MQLFHTTKNGVEIYVEKGSKSKNDFIVRYKEPGKRRRTPKHVHLTIDLYMKKENDKKKTMELVDYFINMVKNLRGSKTFPPKLQFYDPKMVSKFSKLEGYGEYSIEFLMIVTELIMIQEKTNYPNGTMNLKGFQNFRNESDIFSVVSAATFR